MDKYVRRLNEIGYQPVFLPDPTLRPVTLYYSNRTKLVLRGDFKRYLSEQSKPVFELIETERPDIAAFSTSSKNFSGSITFLQNALGVLGISAPKIDLGFMNGSSASFFFRGVTSKAVRPVDIDTVMANFTPHGIPQDVVERGGLHVAFEYLYATHIGIKAESGFKFDLSAELDLSDYVPIEAEAEFTLEGQDTLLISSHSTSEAAFAYKAGRILLNDGRWEFYPGDIVLGEEKLADYIPQRGIVATALLE